jgi:two-component system cell cycle sensor histidine kinase/response regulator CckA
MSDRLAWLEGELARVTAERDAHALALRRAAAFEAAIVAAPLAIACVSAEMGRYVFVNAAYGRLVGKSPEELMTSDAYEVWVGSSRPEDFAIEHAAVGRLARGEIDEYQIDRPYTRAGAEPRWVRSTAIASRDPGGRLTYVTVYQREIGEERAAALASQRTSAQLQQAQKMDALGKLAGGVAHDFNNRLLIILGYTELLKRELPPGSPLIHHADMVLSSAQRSADLTRQLLAYSRHQVLKPESFDVNQAVERMRQLLAKVIGERVQLSTILGAKNPVFSDPGQLEQVILNLAINARDAMPQGGQLTLATSDRAMAAGEDPALPAGDYVTLTISDTGTGIPDDVLPHIFEPFFTTKPVGQGTGLGLSMAEGIVQQSRGAMRVASRVGEGTTFTIHLPRGRGAPDPLSYTTTTGTPRGAAFETVLVCDDDDDVRRMLGEILRLRAYTILEARTGKHALEIAAAHTGRIHLLVTDLVMPEMGGVDLATEMRRHNPTLRVLFVSGYTDRADVLSGPIRSYARFLAKPFAPGELTRAVFSLLENTSRDPL